LIGADFNKNGRNASLLFIGARNHALEKIEQNNIAQKSHYFQRSGSLHPPCEAEQVLGAAVVVVVVVVVVVMEVTVLAELAQVLAQVASHHHTYV